MARTSILQIIKSLGRGGAETLLPETLKLHDTSEYEFHYIYFLPWKDQMVESIRQYGGKVICIEAKNNFSLLLKMQIVARYVRENNIKLIHAHLPWAGILARGVGKLTGIPVIYTEHNKLERYHFITRALNLITMNSLTEIIAVSADVATSIRRNKPGLTIPLSTILNGVNTSHFSREGFDGNTVRVKLGIPAGVPVVGTIAVFRTQKRLDVWIEVASKILKQNEDAHFIIVGDGPLKEKLFSERSALGLSDRVHFPGLETEVRPYLAAFDIYMMSSMFEGLPIALLEAMSMNCAVITTNAGGIGEVVRHGVDGLVCGVEEPEKLVDFANTLIRDKRLRENFSQQGRNRVLRSFGMQEMVAALENTYRRLTTL